VVVKKGAIYALLETIKTFNNEPSRDDPVTNTLMRILTDTTEMKKELKAPANSNRVKT